MISRSRTALVGLALLALFAVSCSSESTGASASLDDPELAAEGADPEPSQDTTTTDDDATTPTPEPEPTPAPTSAPAPTPVDEPETAASTATDETAPAETASADSDDEATAPPPAADPPGDAGGRDFSEVTTTVQDFVDARGLSGAGLIIVDRDEGVLYHEHFGEFDTDRISLIASSSKMISAGVLLKLQEQGLLDIDAPVATVVDWGEANPDITPAQLVSNSSGLVGLGPNPLYAPYRCQWTPDTPLAQCGESVFTADGDDDDIVVPDTEFRYGGAQWQVAGAVAEAVSGKSWSELIDEIYVEPCGLDSLGFINLGTVITGFTYPTTFGGDPANVAPSDNPTIEGGAYITTGDYGRLLLMHLRGGVCEDAQVLSPESLDIMHADRIANSYDGDAGDSTTGYGMGWWVDRNTGRISDPGAFGSVPWLDLDDGYGAYLVIEDASATGQALVELIEEPVHAAVTAGS